MKGRMGGKAVARHVIAGGGGGGGPASGEMLITASRLGTLPTSGTPYTNMIADANEALTFVNVNPASPTTASPWLTNYDSSSVVKRIAPMTLACALAWKKTGTASYRTKVIDICRVLMGTEEELPSVGSQPGVNPLLATVRQLTGFILAADLVGMERSLTGTRTGWTSTSWETWLGDLRTKPISVAVSGQEINQCNDDRAHNWAAFCSPARIAIDLYLGDSTDLALAVANLRRYCGDRSYGTQWINSGDFDSSWVCLAPGLSNPVTEWDAINGTTCGLGKDGAVVEDCSRSAGSYPTLDTTGEGYHLEAMEGQMLAGILLDRAGYPVWGWSGEALGRMCSFAEREGFSTEVSGGGSWTKRHITWIAKYFYPARTFTRVASKAGQSIGYTDWLYP